MADAIIDMLGPEDIPIIAQLYNKIFRPPRDVESFHRRQLRATRARTQNHDGQDGTDHEPDQEGGGRVTDAPRP